MKTVKQLMKETIKERTIEIRALKSQIKTKQKSQICAASGQSDLASLRKHTRHLFIAYGLIRGKTLEQIEGVKVNNAHDSDFVSRITEHFELKAQKLAELLSNGGGV